MTSLRKLMVLILLALPGAAQAWWNDQWPYRLPIGIDASASGAGLAANHTDATVLVKLHTGNFEDFFTLKEDLSDLRFIDADDKTPLKFHVEHFDLVNQLLYVWVKIPQVVGGVNSGRLWMYYGNAEAAAAQDSGGSFDSATALVYHFAGTGPVQDATANGNNAAAAVAASAAAQIAGGAKFDGSAALAIGDTPALAVQAARGATLSFWVKPGNLQSDAWLFQRSGGGAELLVGLDQNAIYARLRLPNGRVAETNKTPTIRVDSWQHIALIVAPTSMQLLVDGAAVATVPLQLQDFAGAISIGGGAQGGHMFVGEIDELRFDTVARDADWVRLAVTNQGVDNKLLQPQKAEQLGAGGGHSSGFWTVIVGSQDEAGWSMIILLMVMGVVTWFVMAGKALYVGSVGRDNRRFLEQYRALGDRDPALLDREDSAEDKQLDSMPIAQALFGSHDHFQSSPIYRVYHRAVQEARNRLGSSVGAGAAGLSGPAINAIRATLDTQMVLEMQRLNKQMVLLTIAIAGGPFIGLLGTVVGVMITFAAIAATGDVNISAIAPGVAAALAATVMGLLVAIPALFGYNYLMSRIKEATADMRVFADEFIARLAEYHGS